MIPRAILFLALTSLAAGQQKPLIEDYIKASVGPVPAELGLDPFYKKYVDAHGIPIVSSEKVPDAALLVTRDIVLYMLARRPDVRDSMIARKWRVGVMAHSEMTTDIPEHRNLKKPANLPERDRNKSDKEYWDGRARGLGGNPTTCAEENVLGYPGTRYYGEHILVHEFSHAIMSNLRTADPKLWEEIQAAYKEAMAKGLWKGHYGATNAGEYWAEATQTWFWSNYEFRDGDRVIQSPEDLKAYDPRIFELLSRVYLSHRIPMDIYHGKNIRPVRQRPATQEVK